jgi:hypothetical protein
MKKISHIYSFGDSHVSGDELCTPLVSGLLEYLKTVETDNITGSIKIPQRNLDEIYQEVRKIYYSYQNYHDLENEKSFVGYLSKLLKCGYDNLAESGSSNLQSYIQFNRFLPSIQKKSASLNDNEKMLVIYGLTEIERATHFQEDGSAKARSPLWHMHGPNRKNAEKFIELQEMFGDDITTKLYKLYMQMNAIKGQLPDNCDIVFVDPAGLFIDRNKIKIPKLDTRPFIRIQSYINMVEGDEIEKETQFISSKIHENIFNECMYSKNILDKFEDSNNFFKLMPLGHFTENHHKFFAFLLYQYLDNKYLYDS